MGDASKTLQAAQATLASDAPLQADLRQTLQELTRATASMRARSSTSRRGVRGTGAIAPRASVWASPA
jgi:hypothetical protein